MTVLKIYIAINALTLLLYGYDKLMAIKNGRRISEKLLLISALLFGGVGAFVGMKLFRHKTAKPVFMIAVPFLMAIQLVALGFIFGL